MIRVYASVLFTISTLVYMSVVLYAPAVALSGHHSSTIWIMYVFENVEV